jgi:DNA-binding CsgD family transcriptional regulator/tetratricopeptide (TPR) repeat protein
MEHGSGDVRVGSTAPRFDVPARLLRAGRDGQDDKNMTMDGSALVGRTAECARLEQELQKARGGNAAILVLRGRQGLGKTALLDHAVSRASGYRVIRARAAACEAQLPYAALQVLCAQLLDDVGQLPSVQRDALATAIGQLRGSDPNRFLLGLATLNLLARAAGSRPLLCIIDDAQWLDQPSAQALAFAARRLESQPVVLLFATRDQPDVGGLHGLPELRLQGLAHVETRLLLARSILGPIDPIVADRIVEEARGNPLALLELTRAASAAEMAGGFGLSPSRDLSPQIGENLLQQVVALPPQSRQMLLTAAAEPLGDPWLLWRAAAELQLPRTAAEPLLSQGLLSFALRVLFRRPLLRFVVHQLATDKERREVHSALALATDPARDPDHHAWHLAHAAHRPDEGLASDLERLAPVARRRGGWAAAAAFLEQATVLTLDPGHRADRALAAAEAKREAGADHDATRLLSAAEMYPLDDQRQGRLQRQRAHISSRGNPEILVEAARRMQAARPDLARTTCLEALAAAMAAGRLQPAGRSAEIATAALMAPPTIQPTASDRLLDGLATRLTRGREESRKPLAEALTAFRNTDLSDRDARWVGLASRVAADLWDDDAWDAFSRRAVQHAKDAGAVADLSAALDRHAVAEVHFGDFSVASDLLAEIRAVGSTTGTDRVAQASMLLTAWCGRGEQASRQLEAARRDALDCSDGLALTVGALSAAVLFAGQGRYDEALQSAREAAEDTGGPDEFECRNWALAELVEAAARTGDLGEASLALRRLEDRTHGSASDWALGTRALLRALISGDDEAERWYRQAVDRLARCKVRTQLARAQLLYGEWLRRRGRRSDARVPLRAASDLLTAIGATAFAERAHRELLATGERAQPRSVVASRQLTPQEIRIAAMARDGLSNPAIGARIFVSPRTVEYHLRNVFAKLGISCRRELHLVLPGAGNDSLKAIA